MKTPIFYRSLLVLVILCAHRSVAATSPLAGNPGSESIARIHWLGQKKIATHTNAAAFNRIWNEPASTTLKTQTLDRLAAAAWRFFPGLTATNPIAANLLRPLLDDLISEETRCEIRPAPGQSAQLLLAIRLGSDRSRLWESNLAGALKALTGHAPAQAAGRAGWTFQYPAAPRVIDLTRVGDWTFLGVSSAPNRLFLDEAARLELLRSPRLAQGTSAGAAADLWVSAQLDLPRISSALGLGWELPEGFPKIDFSMTGDVQGVRSQAVLDFARPLQMRLDPWQLPSRLLHPPLGGFSAIRGMSSWLGALKTWQNLQIGPPPDQFFTWSQEGIPMLTFFASPLTAASNRVDQFSNRVLELGASWFATNGYTRYTRSQTYNGLEWHGLPQMAPYLQSISTPDGEFAAGGFMPIGMVARTPAVLPFQQALNRTNLIAYDWELTGPRADAWVMIGQFARISLSKVQMPPAAALNWILAAKNWLGPCVTEVTRTGPAQISIARKSSVGFSSVELHLLADWMESPQFPAGFHTVLAVPERMRRRLPRRPGAAVGTSAPPAAVAAPLAFPLPGK